MTVYVGTSGFNYKHWSDGVFYPKGLKQKNWFSFYASRFNTVELNVSFYRLLKKETFKTWATSSPADFLFAVKGSRYITHTKKLLAVEEALQRFSDSITGLGEKLAIVLWQFPKNFKVNPDRLNDFCAHLKNNSVLNNTRHAFEFRHESWLSEDVYKVLRRYKFAFCITDSPVWPSAEVITADYVYLRFHGGKKLYGSKYTKEELKKWAVKITGYQRQGCTVFAYFNNDAFGFAPKNAKELLAVIPSF